MEEYKNAAPHAHAEVAEEKRHTVYSAVAKTPENEDHTVDSGIAKAPENKDHKVKVTKRREEESQVEVVKRREENQVETHAHREEGTVIDCTVTFLNGDDMSVLICANVRDIKVDVAARYHTFYSYIHIINDGGTILNDDDDARLLPFHVFALNNTPMGTNIPAVPHAGDRPAADGCSSSSGSHEWKEVILHHAVRGDVRGVHAAAVHCTCGGTSSSTPLRDRLHTRALDNLLRRCVGAFMHSGTVQKFHTYDVGKYKRQDAADAVWQRLEPYMLNRKYFERTASGLIRCGASVDMTVTHGENIVLWAMRKKLTGVVDASIHSIANTEFPVRYARMVIDLRSGVPEHLRDICTRFVDAQERAEIMAEDLPHCGNTALMLAVEYDDIGAIDPLLRASADVNKGNGKGRTPLMVAVARGGSECAQAMVRKLLDVPTLDVHCADNCGNTALLIACQHQSRSQSVRLLLDARADANVGNRWGSYPLLCAAQQKEHGVVDTLISAGSANTNVRDRYGNTALMLAVKKCDSALVRMLLDGDADANVKDFAGDVPLLVALQKARGAHECDSIVCALLNANANCDVTDKTGHTMLAVALQLCASDAVIAALGGGVHADDAVQSSHNAEAARSTAADVRDV